ncbi:MAG: Nif11-like leader peptide family natural product precursor [Microcoleus sp. CSU_2_2]|nr:Nif11-like leader peptide family natural product precursor [Microcoleus sp. SU_5_3]NJS12093.1 Nif11-like leader peptide family natural product precursor [Microcoleus sp. CSU_2_2]
MSVESVNQLYQEIMQELDLLQQFIAAPDRESLGNMAVEVSQQNGYSFTLDEVKQALAAQSAASEARELSDRQLEAVAGGKSRQQSADICRGEAAKTFSLKCRNGKELRVP